MMDEDTLEGLAKAIIDWFESLFSSSLVVTSFFLSTSLLIFILALLAVSITPPIPFVPVIHLARRVLFDLSLFTSPCGDVHIRPKHHSRFYFVHASVDVPDMAAKLMDVLHILVHWDTATAFRKYKRFLLMPLEVSVLLLVVGVRTPASQGVLPLVRNITTSRLFLAASLRRLGRRQLWLLEKRKLVETPRLSSLRSERLWVGSFLVMPSLRRCTTFITRS